jgi:hypothetical protein
LLPIAFEVVMKNHSMHGRRWTALALAGALATGCGGQSSSEDAVATADSTQSEADDAEVFGDETPTLGGPGALDRGPPNLPGLEEPIEGPPPPEPLPSVVEVSSDATTVFQWGGGVESGRFFTARSALGTTLELLEADERLCVRGQLAPVPDGDYGNFWGAEVGIILSASDPDETVLPSDGFDAVGFVFQLSGELPPQLRFRVGASGADPLTSQYCQDVPVTESGSREVSRDALTLECWNYGGPPFPAGATAALVSWQIPASPESYQTYDFCIEDVRALQPD